MPPEAYRPAKSSLKISRETDLFFFQTLTAEDLRLCFSPSDPPPPFHLLLLLLSNSLPPITHLAPLTLRTDSTNASFLLRCVSEKSEPLFGHFRRLRRRESGCSCNRWRRERL